MAAERFASASGLGARMRHCGAGARTSLALKLALVLGLLSTGLLGGCAWWDSTQNRLSLRPTPGRPADLPPDEQLFRPGDVRRLVSVPASGAAPVTAATATAAAQTTQLLALWWLPHANPQAPTLLYLHGTFRNLYRNLPKINALREIGFAVLAVDYRGWGDSSPIVPDESTITADAARAFAELQQLQPDPAQRVIYGHSMGGAVAVRLASGLCGRPTCPSASQDYAALVLESTFTRLPEVAAAAGWIGRLASRLTTLEFDSLQRIGRIDAPLLMLHGQADTTVPVALGRRLRDAAPAGVRWIEVPAGSHSRLHSDAPALYAQAFNDLLPQLSTHTPTQTPTQIHIAPPP